jgi:hypothetical protein
VEATDQKKQQKIYRRQKILLEFLRENRQVNLRPQEPKRQ